MSETMTQNAQAASAPVSSKSIGNSNVKTKEQAPVVWNHAVDAPKAPGMIIIPMGTDTGRKDKQGNAILTRSQVVKVPTVKETGKSGDEARQAIIKAGSDAKPGVMGRVSAFAAHSAVIVRRYQETPGNGKTTGDKISVTLERRSVETDIEKLARAYGLTAEEVARRLNVKAPGAGTTLNV